MAAVPNGFLRHYVLQFLNEKPMSGSEIMNEIESRTNGHWKPSPGSIYPLLSWLQEKGYSEEVPDQEPGIKRYTLTDEGKKFPVTLIKGHIACPKTPPRPVAKTMIFTPAAAI